MAGWRKQGCMACALALVMTSGVVSRARGEEPPSIEARMQLLEDRAARAEQRVEQLEGHVTDLETQLSEYKTQDDEALNERLGVMHEQLMEDLTAQLREDTAGHGDGSGYGEGFEVTFWVWLTYMYQSDRERSTFWAWEVEMDVTKTFSDRLAGAFDVELVDTNSGARADIEQAFLSAVVFENEQTILTFGKFNAPFGAEANDFWDRYTGSESLLFDAMPHNLTGLMVTQPIGGTGFKVQPFVINGFDDDLDINRDPSVGVVAAYEPSHEFRLAVTNYFGPEMAGENGDKLYLVIVDGRWLIVPGWTLWAEYLYGNTESEDGRLQWTGAMALLNIDLNEKWRVFGRFSYLDDTDGFVTGRMGIQHEVGVGFGWYLHPMVELRTEYRHDFNKGTSDADSVFVHVTFGF